MWLMFTFWGDGSGSTEDKQATRKNQFSSIQINLFLTSQQIHENSISTFHPEIQTRNKHWEIPSWGFVEYYFVNRSLYNAVDVYLLERQKRLY